MLTSTAAVISTEESMEVGLVMDVDQGRPLWINHGKDRIQVQFLSHSLPYLNVGDRVVYTKLQEGVMVLYQIKPVHEHQPVYYPRQSDADSIKIEAGGTSLTLRAGSAIQFKVNDHQMLLDHQGQFICQANEVQFISKTDITLAAPGHQIHLTTKE